MQYQNILLIDDDLDDHEIFLSALERITESTMCTALNTATEALQKLESGEIKPDLIFLDLNMPLMNGQQFLMEIKKNEALLDIPVIIFTTSSNASTIQETKELGASDFITKPERFDDLVTILQNLLS